MIDKVEQLNLETYKVMLGVRDGSAKERTFNEFIEYVRDQERDRVINHPEIADFARAIVLEAQHQRERWDDSWKKDFDWAATAGHLLAKAYINPVKSDMSLRDAKLHRIITIAALCANWHAATAAVPVAVPNE